MDLSCNKSTFLAMWLLNSIKLFDFEISHLYNKDNYFYLILLMCQVSYLAQRQHSKNVSSYPTNVIILFMVDFLLDIKKGQSQQFLKFSIKLYCGFLKTFFFKLTASLIQFCTSFCWVVITAVNVKHSVYHMIQSSVKEKRILLILYW